MGLTALVVAQDLVTSVCGMLNAGYFSRYVADPAFPRRRVGAAALVLLGLAAAAEALFSQALFWSRGEPLDVPAGVWVLARVPLLVATAFISAIVLRKVLS